MKAVIMAGGEGTRLRPLTSNCPKPMLPLANRPMMEHIVGLLKRNGIDEIVVTVAFLANQIRNYFVDVLAIDPGEMDTKMHADALPEADPAALARPEAVAAAILEMIGDPARAPSGARLSVPRWQVEVAR